jgi:hypothetical protein
MGVLGAAVLVVIIFVDIIFVGIVIIIIGSGIRNHYVCGCCEM